MIHDKRQVELVEPRVLPEAACYVQFETSYYHHPFRLSFAFERLFLPPAQDQIRCSSELLPAMKHFHQWAAEGARKSAEAQRGQRAMVSSGHPRAVGGIEILVGHDLSPFRFESKIEIRIGCMPRKPMNDEVARTDTEVCLTILNYY